MIGSSNDCCDSYQIQPLVSTQTFAMIDSRVALSSHKTYYVYGDDETYSDRKLIARNCSFDCLGSLTY